MTKWGKYRLDRDRLLRTVNSCYPHKTPYPFRPSVVGLCIRNSRRLTDPRGSTVDTHRKWTAPCLELLLVRTDSSLCDPEITGKGNVVDSQIHDHVKATLLAGACARNTTHPRENSSSHSPPRILNVATSGFRPMAAHQIESSDLYSNTLCS